MKVNQVMTAKPACCGPDTSLQDVAHLMVAHDCGEIPVTDAGGQPLGVVTDRDIVVRTLAVGLNPMDRKAGDVMTSPCLTVVEDCEFDDCKDKMEEHQVRRMLVVDDKGACCGVVSQADIVRRFPERAARLVGDVSRIRPESAGASR